MADLTPDHMETLYEQSSPERRAILAEKIAQDLDDPDLTGAERAVATDMCRKMASDVEQSVRVALSNALKKSPHIPSDVAAQLAHDALDVALPILEFSEILDDDVLVSIVRDGDELRQMAITQRAQISENVSDTLASFGGANVVCALLDNAGAKIAQETLERAFERFIDDPDIHNSMAQRQKLPQRLIDKMMSLVSETVQALLAVHHPVSHILAERLVLESREDAKARLLANPQSYRDTAYLVETLAKHGKLSVDLIFRAIEIGDRSFFEQALAHRAQIPLVNAQKLLKDKGGLAFKGLYEKAGLPKNDLEAMKFLIDAEYNNPRHKPITSAEDRQSSEPENWLTKTLK